jgi:hypothetical protein
MLFSVLSNFLPVSSRLQEEQSLISELFEYFKEQYFTPQFGDYQHFSVETGSGVTLQTIVFGFFIGINLASLAMIFDRRVLGNFVRKLISEECLTTEKAKTLSELGFLKNSAIRSSLKSGVTLRRVVRCVEEDEYNKSLEVKRAEYNAETDASAKKKRRPAFREVPFAIDFKTAHFYIPQDMKYKAEIKFEKKGTNWLSFFAVLVFSLILMVLVIKITPDLLQMLDNFLTSVSGD